MAKFKRPFQPAFVARNPKGRNPTRINILSKRPNGFALIEELSVQLKKRTEKERSSPGGAKIEITLDHSNRVHNEVVNILKENRPEDLSHRDCFDLAIDIKDGKLRLGITAKALE